MFFGLSFPFRVIVDLFDEQDGLRKLFNVVWTEVFYHINLYSSLLAQRYIAFFCCI